MIMKVFKSMTGSLSEALIHMIVLGDGDNMSLTHHLRAIATARVTNEDP